MRVATLVVASTLLIIAASAWPSPFAAWSRAMSSSSPSAASSSSIMGNQSSSSSSSSNESTFADYRRQMLTNPAFMNCVVDVSQTTDLNQTMPITNVTMALSTIRKYLPCIEKVKSARPFIVVFHFLEHHYDNTSGEPTRQACGISANASASSRGAMQKQLYNDALDTNMPFCQLWFKKLVPAFCNLINMCPNQAVDIDQEFAAIYALQQVARNQSEPFSCKDANGNEELQTHVDGRAYQVDYKVGHQPMLINPPTCASKSRSI